MHRFTPLLIVSIVAAAFTSASGATQVAQMRCEYLQDPQGIDVAQPRLSWVVQSDERGQKQTAYQVLVASSPKLLADDRGDLWDSGRVASDQTSQVEYTGKPLTSRMRCVWKVRVWDKAGQPSPWSEPATWTMGLLGAADWGAKWIAHCDAAPPSPVVPRRGYQSQTVATADAETWVAVDWGQPQKIDAVRLCPADLYGAIGYLFPVRFRIECGQQADFSDATTVVDRTGSDVPNPGMELQTYSFEPRAARFVRLSVTRLATLPNKGFATALAQLQVLADGKNVAQGAVVSALGSMDADGWAKGNLTDGRTTGEYVGNPTQPATMVRKEFDVAQPIKRAVVSVTGLGLYELRINGRRVGDHLLAPEWTRYGRRIQYQTYDVTELLQVGANALGAQMGGGWWTGPLMLKSATDNWPQRSCLFLRLDIEHADGSMEAVISDASWKASQEGPIRRAGIYFGETYDATREMPGWDKPGFAATDWQPVQTLPCPDGIEKPALVAQSNEPIRVMKELQPVAMTEPKPGTYVFDMGQNMVGWCRLTADAPPGTKITLRHAEALNDDGTIYTANLRGAAQVNEYTWRGGPATLEPHFTYHGFRYVELTGLSGKPAKDAIVGCVFHSAAPEAGSFECSSELVNKIMHCVAWVQRGNMHSAPTDCPQRSEREGWMGDIQAFSQTAIFHRDMASFFTKWVQDIRDSQADDGRYPDVAPHIGDPNQFFSGVPAWGDAGVIVPWRVYQNYGDRRMLRQHFDSVRAWVEFIRRNNPDGLWRNKRGNDYGDWLNGDTLVLEGFPRGISGVPNDLLATGFYANSVAIAAQMADCLGQKDVAAEYRSLFQQIKQAFAREYIGPDGRIRGDTQAGYVLALHFGLLDEPQRPTAMKYLLEGIEKYKGHASTGIQTTHRLMLELSRNGRHDEAWRLFTLRTVPSWGYMVDMGATTIWERWDGFVQGRGFQDPGMNSMNHWAFGSVGEWVWRELVGLNSDDSQPGYQHFFVRPQPVGDLAWVKARYDSIRGPIEIAWERKDGRFRMTVEVPANTTATVRVPTRDVNAVTEAGQPVEKAAGVVVQSRGPDAVVFAVESGRYSFESPY